VDLVVKKIFSALLIVCLCNLLLIGCKDKSNNVSDVMKGLKDGGIPISYEIVYTSEMDPNGSKDHAYKEKGNFADSRIEPKYSEDEPLSGSIEIFESAEKAEERAKYLDGFSSLDSFGYKIINGEILIRLSSKYTAEEVKKIEGIFGGKLYTNSKEEINSPKEKTGSNSESIFDDMEEYEKNYGKEEADKIRNLQKEEEDIKQQKERIKQEIEDIIGK
jgi:uncharacterized protein YdcH (DUF465 family)